jgi:hypothetical protein
LALLGDNGFAATDWGRRNFSPQAKRRPRDFHDRLDFPIYAGTAASLCVRSFT